MLAIEVRIRRIHLTGGADRLTNGAELYRAHKAPFVVLSGGVMP